MALKPSFFGDGTLLPDWDDGVRCFALYRRMVAGDAPAEVEEEYVLHLRRFVLMRMKQSAFNGTLEDFQRNGEQAVDVVTDLASELWRKTRNFKLTHDDQPRCLWAVFDTTLKRLIYGKHRKLKQETHTRASDVFRGADRDPLDTQFSREAAPRDEDADGDLVARHFGRVRGLEETLCAEAVVDRGDDATAVRACFRLLIRHLLRHGRRLSWRRLPGRLKAKISYAQHLLLQSRIAACLHVGLPRGLAGRGVDGERRDAA